MKKLQQPIMNASPPLRWGGLDGPAYAQKLFWSGAAGIVNDHDGYNTVPIS